MSSDPALLAFLEAQRAQYRASLPQRLALLERSWEEAGRAADPAAPLRELERCVHSLAGSAATFGLRELGDAARELELALEPLVQRGEAAALATQPLRTHYDALRQRLQTAIAAA